MNAVQLANIRWLSPAAGCDRVTHLRADTDGLTEIDTPSPDLPCLDGEGLWLLPGLIDLAMALPEPGPPHPGDLGTELRAARRGGIALVCGQPDTAPPIDNASVIEWIERRAAAADGARLRLLGALTQRLNGEQLSDMAALKASGCAGLAQGDAPLPPPEILRQCLHYAADLDLCIHLRPQWPALAAGCAHDGARASALGLAGVPAVSETLAIAAILTLVEDSGCAVHFSRLSTARGADMIAEARERGLPVSADVAIWNLLYDDSRLADYVAHWHLDPPLRSAQDRAALRRHLAAGDLDAVCSDHRPLGPDAKLGPFEETRPGASGVDTLVPQLLTLVADGTLTPLTLAERLHQGPARVLRLPPEETARWWSLIDPDAAWQAGPGEFASAGGNSPLRGESLRGRAAGSLDGPQLRLNDSWQSRLRV